jgi:ribose transport system permease protein
MTDVASEDKTKTTVPERSQPVNERASGRVRAWVSPKNIGAVYVWIVICLLFVALSPDRFGTVETIKSVLDQYAITGIVALSLIIPLAAGFYDLSIGYTVSLSGVFMAWLTIHTSLPIGVCCVLTMAMCLGVGLINAFVVVGLGINSFIATLGTGAILASITIAFSGQTDLVGRIIDFSSFGQRAIAGVQMPVLYMLAIALVLAYVLQRTRLGRELYATGFNKEAARLSGVQVNKLATLGFVCSAMLSGFAGLALAAIISAGSPTAGPSYLLGAFSAVFLGATQLRRGRFNSWGTVIAVLMIGTGNVGLLIVGAPVWTPQLFQGVVLIAAVALTFGGRGALTDVLTKRSLRRGRMPAPPAAPDRGGASGGAPTFEKLGS